MAAEAIMLGLVLGLIYFELCKLSPPGIVAPGYCALVMTEVEGLLYLLAVTAVTFVVLKLLSRALFIFGRRALLLAIIIGFILSFIIHAHAQQHSAFILITHLVPGEIAYECYRQGVVRTMGALLIVSIMVKACLVIRYGIF